MVFYNLLTQENSLPLALDVVVVHREAGFLGEQVIKYHRTLTTCLETLLQNGFLLRHIVEPQPPEHMMDLPGMKDELRRPMMLLVSAEKQ